MKIMYDFYPNIQQERRLLSSRDPRIKDAGSDVCFLGSTIKPVNVTDHLQRRIVSEEDSSETTLPYDHFLSQLK